MIYKIDWAIASFFKNLLSRIGLFFENLWIRKTIKWEVESPIIMHSELFLANNMYISGII